MDQNIYIFLHLLIAFIQTQVRNQLELHRRNFFQPIKLQQKRWEKIGPFVYKHKLLSAFRLWTVSSCGTKYTKVHRADGADNDDPRQYKTAQVWPFQWWCGHFCLSTSWLHTFGIIFHVSFFIPQSSWNILKNRTFGSKLIFLNKN